MPDKNTGDSSHADPDEYRRGASRRYANYEIDLMLLDLVLPDLNGFELVSLLRQNKSTQNTPIIAISALVRERERERAMISGCNDYLIKPYFLDDLDRIIRQYLPQSFFKLKSLFTRG